MAQKRTWLTWRVASCLLLVAGVPIGLWLYLTSEWGLRGFARKTTCESHLRQAAQALLMYAEDHGGLLPPGPNWYEPLEAHHVSPDIFVCQGDPADGPVSYGMNPKLFGARISDHDPHTVLLYDGWNGTVVNRHRHGANYAWLNGEVEWLTHPPNDLPVTVLKRDPPRRGQ